MAKRKKKQFDPEDELIIQQAMNPELSKFKDRIQMPKIKLTFRNQKQSDYAALIEEKQIILSYGPAGTGKSFIGIAKALEMLQDGNRNFHKIHIITPAIESEERIGFLPGDLLEKLHPYLYSTYYLIDKLIGKECRQRLINNGTIEPMGLGFLRGVNVDNAILIFEESQNASITSMKTLLTRIGRNSKFIISGDLEQIDNEKLKVRENSGLYHAMTKLKDIKDIGTIEFTKDEIVRNPLISNILEKF